MATSRRPQTSQCPDSRRRVPLTTTRGYHYLYERKILDIPLGHTISLLSASSTSIQMVEACYRHPPRTRNVYCCPHGSVYFGSTPTKVHGQTIGKISLEDSLVFHR